jgi:hemin uptake protein HemP
MNARLDPQILGDALRETPVHDAETLTAGGTQARIVLRGQIYSLRITRAGKLILTK